MEPDYRKIFGRAIVVCWAVIIFCWVVSLFRPEWFLIVVENSRVIALGDFIERHTWALYLFTVCSSCISMFPYWLACLGKRWFENKKQVWACVFVVIGSVFIRFQWPVFGFVVDALFVFTTFPVILGGNLKKVFPVWVAFTAYQAIIILARGYIVMIDSTNSNVIATSCIGVDGCAMNFIIYSFYADGGDLYVLVRNVLRQIRRRFAGYACESSRSWQNRRSRRNRQAVSRAERKVRFELFVRRTRAYAIVFGGMGIVAILGYHVMEAFILFCAYLALRWTFPKTFHTTPWRCTAISLVLFTILIANAVPLSISLTGGVITALLLGYALWRTQDYVDLKSTDAGRERTFREKCKAAGLSDQMIDFAVDYKIKAVTVKEQMAITGLGESTVKNYRTRVNKSLK